MSSAAEFCWEEMVPLDDLVVSGEVQLGRGNIISKIDIRNNPGPYPIYSSSSKNGGKMGEYGNFMFNEELISWSVDGGGYFFHRPKHKFSVTNVSGYMRLSPEWDYRFTAYSLQFQHEYFSFDYQTKAHPSVIREFYLFPKVPLPEQQKIAAILSSVDDVIEKTRAQIDKLKDLKTGMMQELLTKGIGSGGVPHTEFKDSPLGRIPASWDVRSLNEVAAIKHGYAFEGEYFRSNPTPYLLLTPGNFNKDGRLYFGPKTKYYDGPVPAEFILKNGDVLVVMTDLTKEMAILGNTIILKSPRTVLHNQRIGKVTILGENILSPEYLCFVMNSDRVKGHIKDTATGTTVRHTSPTKILEPLVPIPPIQEQEKIMSIFQTLDDRLAVTESKLASHEKIKKALMQDLLTGKVRVKVDQKESAVA